MAGLVALGVLLVVVGVLVWPTPKEARAHSTTFKAYVDWVGVEPDPNNISLTVYTYDDSWIVVESWGMSFVSTSNGTSIFERVEQFDLDPDGIHWGVTIDPGPYTPDAFSIVDGDQTNFGGMNTLDDHFVLRE
jgi:hypothetical protein